MMVGCQDYARGYVLVPHPIQDTPEGFEKLLGKLPTCWSGEVVGREQVETYALHIARE